MEKSEYAGNHILKGGLFLYTFTNFDSRVTVDVDFLLRQIPNTPEQLRVVLGKIIAINTGNDFVTFEVKSIGPIALAKNTPTLAQNWLPRSRTRAQHSALTLVLVTSLSHIRKNAPFRRSFPILLRLKSTPILLRRRLPKSWMRFSA